MNSDDVQPWRQVTDDALVERLIAALQQATASTLGTTDDPPQTTNLPAPEMATALLNLLASVLEPAPQCRTPMAMRKVSEAAGKELLMLMRGVRTCAATQRQAELRLLARLERQAMVAGQLCEVLCCLEV